MLAISLPEFSFAARFVEMTIPDLPRDPRFANIAMQTLPDPHSTLKWKEQTINIISMHETL